MDGRGCYVCTSLHQMGSSVVLALYDSYSYSGLDLS